MIFKYIVKSVQKNVHHKCVIKVTTKHIAVTKNAPAVASVKEKALALFVITTVFFRKHVWVINIIANIIA